MNILVVSTLFGEGYGAGYAAYKECLELSKRGNKLFIVHSEPKISKYKDKVSKYFYIPFHKTPLLNILYLKKDLERIISKILEKNKIDIIYLNTLEFGLIRYSLIKNYNLVYFLRSSTRGIEKNKSQEYWKDSIRRFFITKLLVYLENRCLKWSQKIIVKSNLMRREIVNLYPISFKKIRVISGGFDKKDFPLISYKKRLDFKSKLGVRKEKIIIFAGRLAPVKGLIYLIDAMPNILKRYDSKLFILGGGFFSNYKKILLQKVKDLGLREKVIFVGKIPQNKVYRYMSVADIFEFPSTYEPFGMVAIQAASYRIPIVLTKIIGAKELLKNYGALRIIKPYSSKEIATASINLLSNKERGNIINFKKWEKVAEELEEIFITSLKQ